MSDPDGGHPRDRLSPYLDDELAVEERAAVDRHLAACEDCRVELDALRRLARALADESVPPPSADLLARIGRRVDAGGNRRQAAIRLAIPATIAATLGAIGILVAIQWRDGRLPPSAPPRAVDERQAAEAQRSQDQTVAPTGTEASPRGAETKNVEKRSVERPERPSVGRTAGESAARGPETAEERPAAISSPNLAAKVAFGSPCDERWSDSGMRATWAVADAGVAARELERIAREAGGTGVWRRSAGGTPYLLLVPRSRFEQVVNALRARGVEGLDAVVPLSEGMDCAGISVAIHAGAPGSGPAPR